MSIEDVLHTGTIVALPDEHTNPKSRLKAQELINKGLVNIFFLEYQRCAKTLNTGMQEKYGIMLNSAISEMLVTGVSSDVASKDLESYFIGINQGDAEPSLRSLTATAIGKGVQVVACDMDYSKAPDAFEAKGLSRITSLFLCEGLTLRDTYAAEMIANYLRIATGKQTGRLMLWGANHFTENSATVSYPDTRLQTLLAEKGLCIYVATPQDIS